MFMSCTSVLGTETRLIPGPVALMACRAHQDTLRAAQATTGVRIMMAEYDREDPILWVLPAWLRPFWDQHQPPQPPVTT